MLTLSFVGKQPQDIIFLLKAGNITLFLALVVVSTVLIFFIKKKVNIFSFFNKHK